jgi:hypothetical protein
MGQSNYESLQIGEVRALSTLAKTQLVAAMYARPVSQVQALVESERGWLELESRADVRILAAIAMVLFGLSPCAIAATTRQKPSTPPCNCPVSLPPATTDKRGTEESPLSVKVTQLPPKTGEELSREENSERHTLSLGVWTVAVAGVTAVILILPAHRVRPSGHPTA